MVYPVSFLKMSKIWSPSSDVGTKIKAVFLYNFTKYFEWPDNKKTGNFIIYVVGKNENVIAELKGLATKKKVGNQDIEIKSTLTFDPGVTASIIYLLPTRALINDLYPIQRLIAYHDEQQMVGLKMMHCHSWYLSPELTTLSLFSECISLL